MLPAEVLSQADPLKIPEVVICRISVDVVNVKSASNLTMMAFPNDAMQSHALALKVTTAAIVSSAHELLNGVTDDSGRPNMLSALIHFPPSVKNR